MGLEARCLCTWRGTTGIVRAHLDSGGLNLVGAHRLHIALSDVTQTTIDDGALKLQTREGVLLLAIPTRAETWARNISNPRSRIEKLGIARGSRVFLAGDFEPQFMTELSLLDCKVLRRAGKHPVEAIFMMVNSPSQLQYLKQYRTLLVPGGALWVIRKKGKDAPVSEAQVRTGAKRAGLVDVKVVAFSSTHSGEKLVIPRAQRG